MGTRVAVLQFPGSNADWDALHAARDVVGTDAYYVFHKERSLRGGGDEPDAVIVPGGFSFGDYLRAGAIACFSPIVPALVSFAKSGGPVLGICNGFQILTELGLLPGTLTRNKDLRFECRDVFVRVDGDGLFTDRIGLGTTLRLPIAHAEGRYQCDAATLRALHDENRVAFRYCDQSGARPGRRPSRSPGVLDTVDSANPNGSLDDIAGVYNEARNVLGLMPHPERAAEPILGNADGLSLLEHLTPKQNP